MNIASLCCDSQVSTHSIDGCTPFTEQSRPSYASHLIRTTLRAFLRVTPPPSLLYPWLQCCCAHILLLSVPSLCLQVWPVVSFLTANGFLSETSLLATSHLVTAVFPSPPMLTSWPQIHLYLLPPTTYFYFCFPKGHVLSYSGTSIMDPSFPLMIFLPPHLVRSSSFQSHVEDWVS